MEQVAEIIEKSVRPEFPNVVASIEAQKRAVLIVFDKSNRMKFNFTADVVVALDYNGGEGGLLIPNLHTGTWERSHPVLHTRMIEEANIESRFCWNRTVRLAKYWNRRLGQPFSSWNIKALALNCPGLHREMATIESLQTLFEYARASVSAGPTVDPAGVSAPVVPEVPKKRALGLLASTVQSLEDVVQALKTGDAKKASARFGDVMQSPSNAAANFAFEVL